MLKKLYENISGESHDQKLTDFKKAKEVLFSSKNKGQLITAVKYINNFNKKHKLNDKSPEFIYFKKMVNVLKHKLKNIDDSLGESLEWDGVNDESFSKDSNWEVDPNKSYWKQGSSGSQTVTESSDFDWISEVPDHIDLGLYEFLENNSVIKTINVSDITIKTIVIKLDNNNSEGFSNLQSKKYILNKMVNVLEDYVPVKNMDTYRRTVRLFINNKL